MKKKPTKKPVIKSVKVKPAKKAVAKPAVKKPAVKKVVAKPAKKAVAKPAVKKVAVKKVVKKPAAKVVVKKSATIKRTVKPLAVVRKVRTAQGLKQSKAKKK